MSKISFLDDPFPNNHDGFDYSPKSVGDVMREMSDIEQSDKEKKLLFMLASIMK